MLLFRFFSTWLLLVSFHPSQFRSRSCSTGAYLMLCFVSSALLSVFPLLFCFLSSASFPVLTTQPLFFLFPSSLFSLFRVFQVLVFPFPFPPVSMRSVLLPVLSIPAFLFSAFLFRNTGATPDANLLFPVRLLPLAFALGSGYSAWAIHPEN